MHVAELMRSRVRVIELGPDKLIYQQADNFPDDPGPEIRDALFQIKNRRWLVEQGTGDAQPSLREVEQAEAGAARDRILSDPLVKATLAAFPAADLLEANGKVARAAGSKWN